MTPALCESAGLQDSGARSVKGQPLLRSDVPAARAFRRVLVVGAIHGDEMSSAALGFHWLKMAQAAPAQTHWRFIPVLNPDGLLQPQPQRMNARGVDLNRNFPTPSWQRETRAYWEQRTRKDPRRWPGPAPLSEPEAKFLHDEIVRFQPGAIISIHAPYGVLDFDGPVLPPTRLGRLHLEPVGVFPGSLGNYAGLQLGVPVVTVELPRADRPPPAAEIRRMWKDLRTWLDRTLRSPVLPAPKNLLHEEDPEQVVAQQSDSAPDADRVFTDAAFAPTNIIKPLFTALVVND